MAGEHDIDLSSDGDPADPYDRRRHGYSLSNLRELVFGCLEAAGAKSVVEVGAQHGAFTRELLAWAGDEKRIAAIDPLPQPELNTLAAADPRLHLVRATSVEALRDLPRFDAYVIDGDHNYFTVSAELEAIAAVAGERPLPLLLFHDVGWPHARRDSYCEPERGPGRAPSGARPQCPHRPLDQRRRPGRRAVLSRRRRQGGRPRKRRAHGDRRLRSGPRRA